MRKFLIVLALLVPLGGCANLQPLFQNYNNPITKQTLYNVENAAIVAFAGLNAYKKSCAQGLIPPTCKDTIAKIQSYTREIPTLLTQLRVFVKNNDQVNARVAYAAITSLISQLQADAAAAGVK